MAKISHGSMQVDFLNAGGTSLGSTLITSLETPTPGTRNRERPSCRSAPRLCAPRSSATVVNAYIDNVDVRVTAAANELLFLEVNTTNGQVAIKNQTGDPLNIDYYKIESAGKLAQRDGVEQPSGTESGRVSGRKRHRQWLGAIWRQQLEVLSVSRISRATVPWRIRRPSDLVPHSTPARTREITTIIAWLTRPTTPCGATAWDRSVALPNDPIGGTIGVAQYNQWRANFGRGSRDLVFRYAVVPAGGGPGTLVRGFVRYVTSGAGCGGGCTGTVVGPPDWYGTCFAGDWRRAEDKDRLTRRS